ncbi:nucleotidyltransferase domain-containing protein [Herbiconiux sp. KACC 21604]|uniref:nucleotidyltransferase domain-containing protein n=1 Tax=unclassified Herbiconiux TaxID=2618217 RepID=UPI0014925A4B|nr:nucleotidyltransferase domain-containing protein [Herbiconiux sp. SALV-R1]QJU54635.1 nucleotidyltransferase domain-containing protein [Herbiconiux sp. SALV-R1]WPO85731.1 nucleotidyltransferase domain-containing protein [Herbiconiux sp. KACC 21604]
MQVQMPFWAITKSLDGAVLEVLVHAHAPMSIADIARATSNSYAGVRSTVHRLASQGTVLRSPAGKLTLYSFNAEHILAGAVREIVSARARLWARISELVPQTFADPPVYAAVFGSAATGTMQEDSDIDLFFERPAGADPGRFEVDAESVAWQVFRLTGNEAHPLIYAEDEVAGALASQRVLADIARDGVPLAGDPAAFRRRLRRGRRGAEARVSG